MAITQEDVLRALSYVEEPDSGQRPGDVSHDLRTWANGPERLVLRHSQLPARSKS